MTKKQWIWITIIISLIHFALTRILEPISGEILWTRFDGNPYESPIDRYLLGVYFLLYIPYYIISFSAMPISSFTTPTLIFAWVVNSIIYGLIGAWLISKLPFMRSDSIDLDVMNNQSEESLE
jgi:hypothetical protein